ncbi:hypothetical protein AAF712_014499 [Marasmius tenuissimus]|uniref:Peptidase M12A domain-containing protein n=1 Tax=Marasmius tenuissimus TaxID=585030 RepID=A0ABR2ZC56_9AGAR
MAGVCNCRFVLLPSDPSGSNDHIPAADVRIRFSFHSNDSWSYIGTQILEQTKPQQPTMNIAVSPDLSNPDFVTTLLHETGHTLGFTHEHFRPGLIERIDEKEAIAYYKTMGWTEDQTKRNVLKPLSPTHEYDLSYEMDIHSIMCYAIPNRILKDGSGDIPGGQDLSEYDKKHAAKVYPIPELERRVTGKSKDGTITSKDSYLLTKNGVFIGCLEVDRHRECSHFSH